MKGPLYISDDGQKQGTQAEVLAYENNALRTLFLSPWRAGDQLIPETASLLNLMPFVEELRQAMDKDCHGWRKEGFFQTWGKSIQSLLLAYEKALGIEQPS